MGLREIVEISPRQCCVTELYYHKEKKKGVAGEISRWCGVQSQAHATFLKAQFGAKVRLVNPDGNDEIEIQGYNISSKTTVKDLLAEMKKHGRN
jgi:hypothetical protein